MLSAISQAWASWKTAPGIALLAVIAFAVGIGSATAIFTVVNGVLLRPLPYPGGERFVALYGASTRDATFMSLSIQDLQAYQQQTTTFDTFGWFRSGRYNLTAPGEPQLVQGVAVTPALARQLGPPVLGQWFADDSSLVISSALWKRLGSRPGIVGSAITLDGRSYTVSGVMAPAFEFPIAWTAMVAGDTDVWLPLDPAPTSAAPGNAAYFSYARRKPGVSLDQAQADASRVAASIAAADPQRHAFYTAKVVSLRNPALTNLRATLLTLLGGAALLLLIACANVATLMLARAVVRARETAIRVALGASRRQLALRYFAEGALVSVAGAAAGVGLSVIFVRQILAVSSEFVPHADEIATDWTVLGFSVAVAIATGLLAGLAPLWQAMSSTPGAVLTDGVRASASAPARRVSNALVVAEIALAFTLVASSAILVVHLRNLGHVSLGFDPNGLLTFELPLPPRLFANKSTAGRIEQERLMEGLRQIPGVTAATFANQLPTYPGCLETSIDVNGRPANAPVSRICLVSATPDFFTTMRIPIRSGRGLTTSDDDRHDVLPVAINETAARTLWPGRTAVGGLGHFSGPDGDPFEVIGVVGDIRNDGLNKPPLPELYLSANAFRANPMNVIVRSKLPTGQLIGAVRRAVRQVDPTLVMNDVAAMNDVISGTLQLERLSSLVMTIFGLAALFMATLGIYGVVAYSVRQRIMEMGTRMALGAVSRDLVALVLGGGLKLAAAGVVAGLVPLVGGVWLLIRVLEVADIGWAPFAASTGVIALVTTAAASVPAWRTTLLSPMVAIREQSPSVWRLARQRALRAARAMRDTVAAHSSGSGVSAADVLTAFIETARGADSYAHALHTVLASVCHQLGVESAALLEGRDDPPQVIYRSLAAVGAMNGTSIEVPADGFLMTRLRAYPFPLPFAPNELPALAEWARTQRPERFDEIQVLAGAGVRLAVPLVTRRETLGVLLLGERQHAGFGTHEKQLFAAVADQFALMLENARLTDRVVEQETLRRDIALASDVQRRLLPDTPPDVDGADFAATSLPARRVGGDYYDFIELGSRGTGIALADVSGKGVAAALIMSVVQASLRIISSEGDVPLPRLVARMNEFVYRSTPGSKYATFFYAQLDATGRQFRYVNAGHNPPFLFRSAGQEIEELRVGGTVVGMFPDMSYEDAMVRLSPGDVLLVFTDGVPEAHSPGNEEFGEDRLQELLRASAHLTAREISARISAAMQNWIRDAEQYDDLTFIVMKVR